MIRLYHYQQTSKYKKNVITNNIGFILSKRLKAKYKDLSNKSNYKKSKDNLRKNNSNKIKGN
jgi:hypothetical protein